ncbi:shieldin complex subunit 2 isoform 5-T6 [Molossus nigricans]
MLTGSRSREAAELRGGARARVGCLQSREAVSETMSRGSEIHVFWGAPIGPLKMTVSQEPTSSVSTADPWTKVQLLYNQHSLHLKDEKCKNKNVEDDQTLGATGSPDLLSGHCLANSRHRCVHVKGRCVGETVLQSTFTSQLLNLGSYSSVQPEEYSSIVSEVVLKDLLAYVSSKHSYLRALPPRQPRKGSGVGFAELERLQPDALVHAVLRVVAVTVLTEALYSYRGQKQRKVMLTVEQAQGQHFMLVLWGHGAAWYPQLQRRKAQVIYSLILSFGVDLSTSGYFQYGTKPISNHHLNCIWEFRYLLAQRNCLLETLELHTTPWSSCERLFDDDVRAVTFNTKFQKSVSSSVKMSDLATHLQDKCSGVILIKAQIVELLFPVTAAQQIVVNAHSSLKSVVSSLPNVTYTGCASCGLELETDGNKIYKQCFSCLPCTRKKVFYRPALMTVAEGVRKVCVRVGSELMEKILLNISPDWLGRVIAPGAEVTYGMVAADVLLALLAAGGAPCDLTVRSLFAGDPNGYPLQQGFSLLGFSPAVRMRAGPGGAQAQPPSDWSEQ